MAPPQEDSDTDSVATDSTENSVQREEYPLEAILAECVSLHASSPKRENTLYLAKWLDYPMHRCTWEPAECFPEESLQEWNAQKALITAGKRELFDVDAWIEEQEDLARQKQERQERRERKREKRLRQGSKHFFIQMKEPNLPVFVSNRSENEDSSDDTPLAQRRRSTRKRPRHSSEDESLTDDSLMDELQWNGKSRIPDPPHRGTAEGSKRPDAEGAKRKDPRPQPFLSKSNRKSDPRAPVASQPKPIPLQKPLSGVVRTAPPPSTSVTSTTATRKTMAKRTGPDIFKNWAAEAPTRKRSVAVAATRQSTKPRKPITLSESRRIQNAALRERETKFEDARALEFVRNGPGPRRASLAETTTADSPGLFMTPIAGSPTEAQSDQTMGDAPHQVPDRRGSGIGLPSAVPRRPDSSLSLSDEEWNSKIPLTCGNWDDGNCPYTAKDCPFLHEPTNTIASKTLMDQYYDMKHHVPFRKFEKFYHPYPLICWYWWDSHCGKSMEDCKFAHWNTGFVASITSQTGWKVPNKVDKPTRQEISVTMATPSQPDTQEHQHPQSRPTFQQQQSQPQDQLQLARRASWKSRRTCFFWKRGDCKNAACEFAHERCTLDADPPAGYVPHDGSYSALDHEISFDLEPPANLPATATPKTSAEATPLIPSTFTMAKPSKPVVAGGDNSPVVGIKVANDPSDIKAKLVFYDEAEKSRFLRAVGDEPMLHANRSIVPTQLREFCEQESWDLCTVGDVFAVPDSFAEFEKFAEGIKLLNVAAAIVHESFILLLYPPAGEEWGFMGGIAAAPGAKLRFQLRGPLLGLLSTPPPLPVAQTDKRPAAVIAFESLYGIKDLDLFVWPLYSKIVEKKAFLLIHPRYREEIEFMTKYLEALECVIYRWDVPGSWEYFVNEVNSGIVVIHPSMVDYTTLQKYPRASLKKLNFWQIGWDDVWSPTEPAYRCVRLFPGGWVIFISDDCFEHHPKEAWDVVNYMVEKGRNQSFEQRTRRLAGRPGLQQFLVDLMEKYHEKEDRETFDPRAFMWDKLDTFNPDEVQDPWNLPNPTEDSQLVSEPREHAPWYDDLWKTSPKKATDCMVQYFAGWACTQALRSRYFIFIHPDPPKEWGMKYGNVEFTTPTAFLETQKKR